VRGHRLVCAAVVIAVAAGSTGCAHTAQVAPPASATVVSEATLSPSVHVSLRVERYRIEARTVAELKAEISRIGPLTQTDGFRYAARTWGSFGWRYPRAEGPAGCETGPISIDVEIVQTFPDCQACSAIDSLARTYRSWIFATRSHEEEHRAIIMATALQLEGAIAHVGAATSCAQLDTAVGIAANEVLQAQAAAHAELDQRTDHGAKTGALLQEQKRTPHGAPGPGCIPGCGRPR